jgi:hypothetical protein
LAEVLRREGDFCTARALCEKVLSIRTIFLGDIHDETLKVLLRLIWIALEEGRHEGLINLTHQANKIFQHLHPAGMFGKTLDMKTLLQPYILQERYLEAELISERALQVLRTVIGDRTPDMAEVLSDCSKVMKMANKHLSAWKLLSRSEAMNEVYSLERQADTFMHTGDFQQAEIAFRQLLANLQKRTTPDKVLVSRVLKKYADVAFKLGRVTDAELLQRRAHDWERRYDEIPDKPLDAESLLLFFF